MIKIIDCGSQLTQNIARRIRELGVFTEIIPFHTPVDKIEGEDLEGIIISGGQFSVYDKDSPVYSKEVFNLGVPVLGICYGQQSIAHLFGGKVVSSPNREYGETKIKLKARSRLFNRIPFSDEFKVWMSHGDVVEQLPTGFETVAISQNNHIAAMQMQEKNIYSVQFHPEVDHTKNGRVILNNFIEICNAQRTWDPEKEYGRMIDELKIKLKGKVGVGGISGGVDSSTVSILVNEIAGENYHPIFVDNGLLRLNEAIKVQESLSSFNLNIKYVDASDRFLEKLKGIEDSDEKRKIIGNEFVAVFEEEARKIPGASYLVQGTLYPDVIESVPVYGSSSKIKRHHNVGGLPEKMGLEVIEPFRNLFKDEVRKIAEHRLRMPKHIVWRHPFPGPGLAVRIIGEVNEEKLRIVRESDDIFISELMKEGLYYQISQAFAGFLGGKTVGVMGDAGTYEGIVGLRAVVTNDFMTADWYDFKKSFMTKVSNRIINEVRGVGSTFYNTSQKPPATIELE
ncbi:MAG: glutamine-hydrolyzing GMP synthase [Candidatus Nanoarchaeia archaeon]|nr:glutamine-hydrolyzing GMP synthase [Candidatus Nanoarchaeia archaeon]MDD5741265.1 glutamine-hydrolyzing GMP synthase [Candidatus Nanoarchaeia archaeon]